MLSTEFTVEEINFICVAYMPTREETISQIHSLFTEIESEEIRSIGESVVNKLSDMSDDEYDECGFNELFSE